MEVADFPVEIIGDQERMDRFIELSLRSYTLELHEAFARSFEELDQTDMLSTEEQAEKRQLESLYRSDTGVRPIDREAFQQRIETSIANGCQETLAEILVAFSR